MEAKFRMFEIRTLMVPSLKCGAPNSSFYEKRKKISIFGSKSAQVSAEKTILNRTGKGV